MTARSPATVSIVVTCYCQAAFIEAMLPPLLATLHSNDEVIISDDGSPDGSAARLADVFAHDQRVRVLASPPRKSVSQTRNRGIQAARGTYVAFLDGDDEYLPNWRAQFAEGFAAFPDADVLFSDYWRWIPTETPRDGLFEILPEDGLEQAFARHAFLPRLDAIRVGTAGDWRKLDSARFNELILEHWVPMHTDSTVFRRQWLLDRGIVYDVRFHGPEDTDFQVRAASGAGVAFLREPTTRYRITPGGLAARSDSRSAFARHLQRYTMMQLPAARPGSRAQAGVWRRVALSELIVAEAALREGASSLALRHALRSFVTIPSVRSCRAIIRAAWRRAGSA